MSEPVLSVDYSGGRRFEVVISNLLNEQTDVIVNAANGRLHHGGGVAAMIASAAGPALLKDCLNVLQQHGELGTGQAVATSAGNMPFKAVIHTVGPRQGDGDELNKLIQACVSAFECANHHGFESLAFPGVSAGIFRVPLEVCAEAYRRAVEKFYGEHPDSKVRLIRLTLFHGPLLDAVLWEFRENTSTDS